MFNLNLTTVTSHSSSQLNSSRPLNSPRPNFLSELKVKLRLHKIPKQVENEISQVVKLTFEEFKKSYLGRLEEKKLYKAMKECLRDAFTKSAQTLMQEQKKEMRAAPYGQEIDFISAIQTKTFLCTLKQKLPNKEIWIKLQPFLLNQLVKIISPATAEHVVKIVEETAKEMNQSPLNCQERVGIALNKTIDKTIQNVIQTKLCLVRNHLSLSNLVQMPSFLEELKLQINDSHLQPVFPVLEDNLHKKVDQLLLNKFHRPVRTEIVKVVDEAMQALISDQKEALNQQAQEQVKRFLLRALCKAVRKTIRQLIQEACQKNQQLEQSNILFSLIARQPTFLMQLKTNLEQLPELYQLIISTLEVGTTYKLRRLTNDFKTVMESTSLLSKSFCLLDENQLTQFLDQLDDEELKDTGEFKIQTLSLNNTLLNLDPTEGRELSTNHPKMVKAIKKLAELPQKQRAKGYQVLFTKICDLEEACARIDLIEANLQNLRKLLLVQARTLNPNMFDRFQELVKKTVEELDCLEKKRIEPLFTLEKFNSETEKNEEASQAALRINTFNAQWMTTYSELIVNVNSILSELQSLTTPRSFNNEELKSKYEALAEQLEKKVTYLKGRYLDDDFEIIQKELKKLVISFLDGLHSSAAQLFKKQNGHLIQEVQAIGEKRNFLNII